MSTEIASKPRSTVRGKPTASGMLPAPGALRERADGGYRVLIAVVLALFGLMLAWNVVHYPAGNSMDSKAHLRYVETIRDKHRLPTAEETHEAQTPPLFYLAAAAIESSWEAVTGAPGGARITHKLIQLFNVLLAVGTAGLVFLIARELFPASRLTQVTAMAFFALSPAVPRTAVMYHSQTLATLLSTAALYVVVRALMRRELGVRAGALAGVLLGLGVLTRVFVLATVAAACLALAAYFAFTRHREVFRVGGVLLLFVVALSAPWFVYREHVQGSPVALSLAAWKSFEGTRDKPFFARQPAEFYVGGPFSTVFTMPYRPAHPNRMPQVIYSDWWGDYFLYYDVPSRLRLDDAPERLAGARLPEPYHGARVRQSYVGLAPTLLMLFGLVGLVREGVRRRSAALLALPATAVLLGIAALLFFMSYPTADGDTMKAPYLLTAVPPLAIGAGWALWRLRERSRLLFGVAGAVLLAAAVFDVQFLWLDHFIGKL